LRNHRFFSLVELNVAIRRLLDELNMRVMRGYGDVLHSVSCAASTRARREKRSIEEANHATHLKKTTLKSVSHHQTRNESPTADAFRHAPSGITCFMDAKTVKNRGAFYVNGDYINVPVRDVSPGYISERWPPRQAG
jgi:hypothetical protein